MNAKQNMKRHLIKTAAQISNGPATDEYRRWSMNKKLTLIGAAGMGAGLMYFFDPDRGKRRRRLLRDKAVHLGRIANDAAGKTRCDIRNHLRGVFARVESVFVDNGAVSNDVLEARVRSKLGRVVSHPKAIEVKAVDGLIILSGPILAAEVHPLLDGVIHVRGVKNIENYLEEHEQAGDIPALQGGRVRPAAAPTTVTPVYASEASSATPR